MSISSMLLMMWVVCATIISLVMATAPIPSTLLRHLGTPIAMAHHPNDQSLFTLSQLNILTKLSYVSTTAEDITFSQQQQNNPNGIISAPALDQPPRATIDWRQLAPQIETPLELMISNNNNHGSIYTITRASRPHNQPQSNPPVRPQTYLITRQFTLDGDLVAQQSIQLGCQPSRATMTSRKGHGDKFLTFRVEFDPQSECPSTRLGETYVTYTISPNGIIGYPQQIPKSEIDTDTPSPTTTTCTIIDDDNDQSRLVLNPGTRGNYTTTRTDLPNQTDQPLLSLPIAIMRQNDDNNSPLATCIVAQNPSNTHSSFFIATVGMDYHTKIIQITTPTLATTNIFSSHESIPLALAATIIQSPIPVTSTPRQHSPSLKLLAHPQQTLSIMITPQLITKAGTSKSFNLMTFLTRSMQLLSTFPFHVPIPVGRRDDNYEPIFDIFQIDAVGGAAEDQHICIHIHNLRSGNDEPLICIPTAQLINMGPAPTLDNDDQSFSQQQQQRPFPTIITTTSLIIGKILQEQQSESAPTLFTTTTTIPPFLTFTIPAGSTITQLSSLPTYLLQHGLPIQTSTNPEERKTPGMIILPPASTPSPHLTTPAIIFSAPHFGLDSGSIRLIIVPGTDLGPFWAARHYLHQHQPQSNPTTIALQPHYAYSQFAMIQHRDVALNDQYGRDHQSKDPSPKPYHIDQSRVIPYLANLVQQHQKQEQEQSSQTPVLHDHLSTLLQTNCIQSGCPTMPLAPVVDLTPKDIHTMFNSTITFRAHKAVLTQSVVRLRSTPNHGPTLELLSFAPKDFVDNTNAPTTIFTMDLPSLFPFVFLPTQPNQQQWNIDPQSITLFFTKNRITVIYNPPRADNNSKNDGNNNDNNIPTTTQPTARTFILSIDLYRLAQTPIILPVTSAVYSHTPVDNCRFTMSSGSIASSSIICRHIAQRSLVEFTEAILTPPLTTRNRKQEDGGDDTTDDDDDNGMGMVNNAAAVTLLHQINEAFFHQSTLIPLPPLTNDKHYVLDYPRGRNANTINLILPPHQSQFESTSTICWHGIDFICIDAVHDGSFDHIDPTRFYYSFLIATMLGVVWLLVYSRHRARVGAIRAEWK